ncbi:MAG TPA: DUF547 domain-containing protein [Thermoanaerobaculia bacterium]|nr:DUF547 domain-containing protein [Thermoanaerobaculia bacterium]
MPTTPQSLILCSMLTLTLTLTTAAGGAEKFSHSDWTDVLAKYVDSAGRVNYAGLARDRAALDRYVAAIEKTSPKSSPELFPTREEALAYYLNAYNAMVVKGVLARLPGVDTVWTPFGTGYSFFVGMTIKIGGQETNLKKLEDDVVRAEFQDPRIHAALNCASIGCPRLPQKAFEPATLDAELDAEMREFVGEARNCSVDTARRQVKLSKIFDWFADDFLAHERRLGNASPNVLDYVNRYRAPGQLVPRDFAVSFFDYDKGLNKQ